MFDRFMQSQFPSQTFPFIVFLQLVSGIGHYQAAIEIHDLQNGSVLARAEGSIDFADRVLAQNLMIPVPPFILPHAGAYDVVILADAQEIERNQFTAVSIEELQHGDNQGT